VVAGDPRVPCTPGITNAGSEATSRVIKTIARDACGFGNPVNRRLRTRTATTRKARGHLNPANFEAARTAGRIEEALQHPNSHKLLTGRRFDK
jgi:hypothetical protein